MIAMEDKEKVIDHEGEFDNIVTEMLQLYVRKNKAYGNSFSETYKKLGVISAVTRITDKVNRLQNLALGAEPNDESMEDTLIDLANYAVMTIIELRDGVRKKRGDKETTGAAIQF